MYQGTHSTEGTRTARRSILVFMNGRHPSPPSLTVGPSWLRQQIQGRMSLIYGGRCQGNPSGSLVVTREGCYHPAPALSVKLGWCTYIILRRKPFSFTSWALSIRLSWCTYIILKRKPFSFTSWALSIRSSWCTYIILRRKPFSFTSWVLSTSPSWCALIIQGRKPPSFTSFANKTQVVRTAEERYPSTSSLACQKGPPISFREGSHLPSTSLTTKPHPFHSGKEATRARPVY